MLFAVPARRVGRRRIRAFAESLINELAPGQAFTCLVTSDAELRRLNREFRKKDYATDVLSFPAGDFGDSLGELAISFDRADAQAAELGHPAEQEIEILMLHGVLHLLGMDHENDSRRMAKAERRWRRHFGLPPGLIERVGA